MPIDSLPHAGAPADPARGTGLAGARQRLAVGPDQLAGRWAYRGRRGAAVHIVIAEDLVPLRDGLIRLLTAYGDEVVAAVETGDELLARPTRAAPLRRLTPREHEVLALTGEGRSNGAIAQPLVVTEKAVSKRINSIFAKLDLRDRDDDHRRARAVLTCLDA